MSKRRSLEFLENDNVVLTRVSPLNNQVEEELEAAVVVRNAHKSYGSGGKVLVGLNMTVSCGAIYGLLGSSGCGKSTLLSCILGIRKLDQGQIYLYGKQQGTNMTREIGMPGRNIGYQSQEISLYSEFTINEMIKYFGVLCGMSIKQIKHSKEFLTDLLKLPEGSRSLSSLSGGQLRRVSFACALIHNPKLIVLDEPTVGVDSILRESIWNHLKTLVSSNQTTVIVTTHYLDEVNRADRIGVMRDGILLAEKSPQQLRLDCNANSLEEAVLSLCRAANNLSSISDGNPAVVTDLPLPRMKSIQTERDNELQKSLYRMAAAAFANITPFSRNLLFTCFMVIIPTIFLSIICLTMGRPVQDIHFGVVNYELGFKGNPQYCPEYKYEVGPPSSINNDSAPTLCDLTMLSCRFLKNLPEGVFTLIKFQTESEAVEAVKEGHVRGFVSFGGNFSEGLLDRAVLALEVDDDVLDASRIIVRLDESNKIISTAMKVPLYSAYESFIKDLLSECGYDPSTAEYPLKFRKPVVGRKALETYVAIAVSASLTDGVFFPVISAGTRLIHERQSGMLERSLVSGMRMGEFMLAYVISESIILLLQITLRILSLIYVFELPCEGNLFLVFVLFFLGGFGGISIGLFLGSVSQEKIQVAIFAIATVIPNMILTGNIWPIESMPEILQDIVKVLPCTLPGESIRSIFNRGWELTHPCVWPGFMVSIIYFVVFGILTLLYHHHHKK